jgi:hypothetical protein
MMVGALTVTAYQALSSFASGMGFSDYTPMPMGAYMRGPTGTPGIQGLGYVSPAPVIGPAMSPRMSGLGAYMQPRNVYPTPGFNDGM